MRPFLFLAVVFPVLFSGCANHAYEEFTFTKQTETIPAKGEVTVFVRGKWGKISEKPKVTHLKSPYDCYVWFNAPGESEIKSIVVRVISFTNQSGEAILSPAQSSGTLKSESEGKKKYFFHQYREVTLPHESLLIYFELELDGEKHSFKFQLDPTHKKSKSNDFIDGILSV